MGFNQSNVQVTEGNVPMPSGIHIVKVTSIEAGSSAKKGTPQIAFTFRNESGQTLKHTLYFTQDGKELEKIQAENPEGLKNLNSIISLSQIKYLVVASKLVSEATYNEKFDFENVEQFAEKLNKVFKDKQFKIKVTSTTEEYPNSKGEIKTSVKQVLNLGFYNCVDSKDGNKLVFTELDAVPYKKKGTNGTSMSSSEGNPDGDLPF